MSFEVGGGVDDVTERGDVTGGKETTPGGSAWRGRGRTFSRFQKKTVSAEIYGQKFIWSNFSMSIGPFMTLRYLKS
jgi:hypothetical protein